MSTGVRQSKESGSVSDMNKIANTSEGVCIGIGKSKIAETSEGIYIGVGDAQIAETPHGICVGIGYEQNSQEILTNLKHLGTQLS